MIAVSTNIASKFLKQKISTRVWSRILYENKNVGKYGRRSELLLPRSPVPARDQVMNFGLPAVPPERLAPESTLSVLTMASPPGFCMKLERLEPAKEVRKTT